MGGVKPRISIFFRLDSTITGLNINQAFSPRFLRILHWEFYFLL
ncbi:hypothetical protein C5167_049788 [Papaver somniferum]|uniref:Uncharacterized protein n=1 Tax=Papaver somniferum TaxID=3469 RepID=A0A4Y7KPJ5_PAPSO|nr:hypothetical protein C5167_049788 [Papaver somniferum]